MEQRTGWRQSLHLPSPHTCRLSVEGGKKEKKSWCTWLLKGIGDYSPIGLIGPPLCELHRNLCLDYVLFNEQDRVQRTLNALVHSPLRLCNCSNRAHCDFHCVLCVKLHLRTSSKVPLWRSQSSILGSSWQNESWEVNVKVLLRNKGRVKRKGSSSCVDRQVEGTAECLKLNHLE